MRHKTLAVIALLFVAFAAPRTVHAKSFVAFLRSVGNSIAHPQHHTKTATTSHSKHSAQPSKQTVPPTAQPTSPAVSNTNMVTATPAPSQPSVAPEPTVRSALLPSGAATRRDVPYGVPVPNKGGFVTSPYAPRAGLVDVRGFPSGTEVKDPYSGKTFLAP